MHAKFAYELIKEAQEQCEKKGLKEIASKLGTISEKLLVETSRKEDVTEHECK